MYSWMHLGHCGCIHAQLTASGTLRLHTRTVDRIWDIVHHPAPPAPTCPLPLIVIQDHAHLTNVVASVVQLYICQAPPPFMACACWWHVPVEGVVVPSMQRPVRSYLLIHPCIIAARCVIIKDHVVGLCLQCLAFSALHSVPCWVAGTLPVPLLLPLAGCQVPEQLVLLKQGLSCSK